MGEGGAVHIAQLGLWINNNGASLTQHRETCSLPVLENNSARRISGFTAEKPELIIMSTEPSKVCNDN